MSSRRLVRWHSFQHRIAEATHAKAVAQEARAVQATAASLQQVRSVNQLKSAAGRVDLELLRWLEPIEQAAAAAHEWCLVEAQTRSEERQRAALHGAQARKQLEIAADRARCLHAAQARMDELRQIDLQLGSAIRTQEREP